MIHRLFFCNLRFCLVYLHQESLLIKEISPLIFFCASRFQPDSLISNHLAMVLIMSTWRSRNNSAEPQLSSDFMSLTFEYNLLTHYEIKLIPSPKRDFRALYWSYKAANWLFPSWILILHPKAPKPTQSTEKLSWPNSRQAENWRVQSISAITSHSHRISQMRTSPDSSIRALHAILMPSDVVMPLHTVVGY